MEKMDELLNGEIELDERKQAAGGGEIHPYNDTYYLEHKYCPECGTHVSTGSTAPIFEHMKLHLLSGMAVNQGSVLCGSCGNLVGAYMYPREW